MLRPILYDLFPSSGPEGTGGSCMTVLDIILLRVRHSLTLNGVVGTLNKRSWILIQSFHQTGDSDMHRTGKIAIPPKGRAETKTDIANDINDLLEEKVLHYTRLDTLTNMGRKDLGNLSYFLKEILCPIAGDSQ